MTPRRLTLAQKAEALDALADELGLVDPDAGFLDPEQPAARPPRKDLRRHPKVRLGSSDYPVDLS